VPSVPATSGKSGAVPAPPRSSSASAALCRMFIFYDLNGLRVTLSHAEAFDLVIGIVAHEIDIEKAADLVRGRTVPR
jgi:hypothetical protein